MIEKAEKPGQSLTIYLAKKHFAIAGDLIKAKEPLEKYPILISSKHNSSVYLYVQQAKPKPPRWARFFADVLDTHKLGKVSSSAAVLILPIEERLFAITFGHGRHLLKPECWEERFGLRAALNSIGDNNVRSIDKTTFDAISKHSKEQTSREANARDFGIDIEQDLLRAVTGTPVDATLGKRMYGMDALNVYANVGIDDLPELLIKFLEKYADDSYKQAFPWVDQIAEVSDPSIRSELDGILIDRIKSGKYDRIWMAVPEVIPWERVEGFYYGTGRYSPGHQDIHLDDFLKSLDDANVILIETLKNRHVRCSDDDGVCIAEWTAYRCLYGEIDYDADSYLLSGGKWYRVTRDFVTEVNRSYRQIPMYSETLPEYNDDSETIYNKRVAESDPGRFALMDCKAVSYGGSKGGIEFCDLYTRQGDLIHVKRYGSSSALSHLFSQGLVSGELFQTEPVFRQRVNEKLPQNFQLHDPKQRPAQSQYQVVFAVVSDDPGDLTLPFFSRLNLKHAARRLGGYGFRVARAKIQINEYRAKTKKYKAAKSKFNIVH
jgi:uncharacterized protein (TIGR04141 family)